MIRSSFGDEDRRFFGGSPQPRLPPQTTAPTESDLETKRNLDKSQRAARLLAAEAQGASRTRLTRPTVPTLGQPRIAALLGGGMGPA